MGIVTLRGLRRQIEELANRCRCTKIRVVNVVGVVPDTEQQNTIQVLTNNEIWFVACDGEVVLLGLTEGVMTCTDVLECLGISLGGDPQQFLNEQGAFVTVVDTNFGNTDLTFTANRTHNASTFNWNIGGTTGGGIVHTIGVGTGQFDFSSTLGTDNSTISANQQNIVLTTTDGTDTASVTTGPSAVQFNQNTGGYIFGDGAGANLPPTTTPTWDLGLNATGDVVKRLSAASIISPSQITSDQDDYNPTDFATASIVRISGDNGLRAITSMLAGADGETKKIINVGSYMLYFPMDHPDGTAANRFTGYNGDFYLFSGQSVDIVYDGTSDRWRVFGSNIYTRPTIYYQWSPGTVAAGDWGYIGFTQLASGVVSQLASTTTLPAAWAIGTAATSNGGGEVFFMKTSEQWAAFASAHIFSEWIISIPTLSDGTETYTTECQITNDPASPNLENNNLFGIRYSSGINSGKFELFSQDNAAGESVADCGVTVAANTIYRLRIEVDKAKTEARAYIDNVYVARITGNIPNSVAVGSRVVMLKSAGTTSRTTNIHSMTAGAVYP